MAISETYGRLATTVDGKVASMSKECLEPQHVRCVSVYVIETRSGSTETYVAGGTARSLRRNLAVGSYLKKNKWVVSYEINGEKVDDFPLFAYEAVLALSVGLLGFAFYSRRP